MAVKKREKRYMTKQEKELRDLAYEHRVKWVEVAEHEDISEPAISQHLKSLTPSKYKHFKDVILHIAEKRTPTKVAS
jgi:DNA-binding transcriptional regulator LsrR (DeoR family)